MSFLYVRDLNSFRVPSSWMNSHSNSHGLTVLPALNAYCEDETAFFLEWLKNHRDLYKMKAVLLQEPFITSFNLRGY